MWGGGGLHMYGYVCVGVYVYVCGHISLCACICIEQVCNYNECFTLPLPAGSQCLYTLLVK